MTTIRRNWTKRIAAIRAAATHCRAYNSDTGNMVTIDPAHAFEAWETNLRATLIENTPKQEWTVHVHSNRFYVLTANHPQQHAHDTATAEPTPAAEPHETTPEGRVIATHRGRTIEITPPAHPSDAPAFTINGTSPYGERPMLGNAGQSATDCLDMIKSRIDERDADGILGINGTPQYAFWYAPGTWEECPNAAGRAYGAHIKPIGAPCNKKSCKAQAARVAARKARRAQGNPTVSALSAQLARAGFERTSDDGRLAAGFRVMKNEGGSATGVRVVWYDEGARMPFDHIPGRLPEIATFLRGKGKYAIRYEGGSAVYVTARLRGRTA